MPIIYSSKPLAPRNAHDFYKTPGEIVVASLRRLDEEFALQPKSILDPGAGEGVWGSIAQTLWPNALITGVELREVKRGLFFNEWITGDYLDYNPDKKFDLIVGNPPFKYAEEFLDKSLTLLSDYGMILFLLRLSFLEGINRFKKYYSHDLRPRELWVSTRRVSFQGDKKSNEVAYALYLWQNGWYSDTKLDWLDWNYEETK